MIPTIGSLKTALAYWVSEQLPGIKTVGTKASNTDHQYPECLITLISESSKFVGLPKNTDKKYEDNDGQAEVVERGKLVALDNYYRLTFSAIDDVENSVPGLTIAEYLREQIRRAVIAENMSGSRLLLTDPEIDPVHEFEIKHISVDSVSNPAPDYDTLPFVYKAAITLRLKGSERHAKAVENVFKNINVASEQINNQ